MRLFTGIELAAPVRAAVAGTIVRLRQHLDDRIPDLHARWVPSGNLHLTLAFIGEVGEARVPVVASALERGFATAIFDLELAAAGAFPTGGAPRVVWIGVSQGAVPLRALHGEIVGRLGELGLAFEARPYSPHLTVARLRDVRGPSARALRDAVREAAVPPAAQRVERSHPLPEPRLVVRRHLRRPIAGTIAGMIAVLLGYLAGSVPFAFLLARRRGIDVRRAGSGNVGAANVHADHRHRAGRRGRGPRRRQGRRRGRPGAPGEQRQRRSVAATGAAAVVGHIYPVWLRFHGGKGVAVAAGVFTVLAPARHGDRGGAVRA